MNPMNDIQLLSLNKQVPEFIVKLYNMLERKEYSKIICWNDDYSEVQIKNCTKLEDTVLPSYFRHGKAESFIRQLNMYGFNKKSRLSHRNSVFYKNEHFRRGDVDSMTKIKRKKKTETDIQREEPTIQAPPSETPQSRCNLEELALQIFKLKQRHPDLAEQMRKIMELANRITSSSDSTVPAAECAFNPDQASRSNMFQTIKDVSGFQNLDSDCSFGEGAGEME